MEKEITRLGKFDKWGYKNNFSKGELARELTYMNEDYANLETQLKKQKEIIEKAIEYIKENKEKYYQDWGQDDGSCDTYLDENEVLKLLQILEDKEVQ